MHDGFTMILSLITLALVLSYAWLIFSYRRNWNRVPEFVCPEYSVPVNISVIVPFRNEQRVLGDLLNCLSGQLYSPENFEVILIDDHSGDHSSMIAGEFCRTHSNFRLVTLTSGAGKKAALSEGIRASRFEWIATTDADCTMGPNWLKTLAAFSQVTGAGFISGLVVTETGKSCTERFRWLEYMALVGAGAGAMAGNTPIYCNAANLFYRRSLFMAFPDPLRQAVISGDDTLFMLTVKKSRPGEIRILKSADSVVNTKSPVSMKEFVTQRKRWTSKSLHYHDLHTGMTAWLVLLTAVGMLISMVLFITGKNSWLFPVTYAIKSIADGFFLASYLSFFRLKLKLAELLLFGLFYPFYVSFVVASMVFTGYSWKNRKY